MCQDLISALTKVELIASLRLSLAKIHLPTAVQGNN